jgi:hypothetical protein
MSKAVAPIRGSDASIQSDVWCQRLRSLLTMTILRLEIDMQVHHLLPC